jgi:modification methylase
MVVSVAGRPRGRPAKYQSPARVPVVVVGDCVAEMAKIAASSVDLVFADPPYNLQLQGDLKRPDDSRRSMPSTTTGTSSRASLRMTTSPAPG